MAEISPLKFPTPPVRPYRALLALAKTEDELRALAKHLLAEIERTENGRQCNFCCAPCEFVEVQKS